MMNEANSFILRDENGKETKYDVMVTFDNELTGKSYIVYTDESVDEDGNIRIFASTYNPDSDEKRLMAIETEEEWETIEILLEEIKAIVNADDE